MAEAEIKISINCDDLAERLLGEMVRIVDRLLLKFDQEELRREHNALELRKLGRGRIF